MSKQQTTIEAAAGAGGAGPADTAARNGADSREGA